MTGTILGVVSIILFLVYYFTGLAFQRGGLTWLPPLISIGMLIYFIIQYSNANGNNVTFGGLFGYGFRSTIIWTLIMFVFMLLVLYLIFPDYKQKAIDVAIAQMEKQSNLSEQQRDTAMGFTEKFFNIFALGGTLLGNIFIGTVGSLLGAAIAKKNPVSPFNQTV